MIGIDAALNSFSAAVVDRLMKAIWAAAMWLLRTAFALMDSVGGFRAVQRWSTPPGAHRPPPLSTPSGPP